ncbi:MAG: hypothetical protein K2X86_02765 [Cytophagaceae bacterium]|nr:hypothetical protein [Cytophagaceae bacterium]
MNINIRNASIVTGRANPPGDTKENIERINFRLNPRYTTLLKIAKSFDMTLFRAF